MKDTDKQENRGGSRPGSGQPKKETKVIYRRVPVKHYDSLVKELDEMIKLRKNNR